MNLKEIEYDERICYTIAEALHCIQIGYEYVLYTKDASEIPCVVVRRKKKKPNQLKFDITQNIPYKSKTRKNTTKIKP